MTKKRERYMNYKKVYKDLMHNRKYHQEITDGYFEIHHMMPKSLGGDNGEDNLVKLTAREHFIAHWLLWKMFGHEQASAFMAMTRRSKGQKRHFSSRGFEAAKKAKSLEMKKSMMGNTHKRGVKESEETRRRKSEYHLGRKKPEHSATMTRKLTCLKCKNETSWSVFTRDHINKSCI